MRIAICEDELADEQFLRQTLELLLNEQNLTYSIVSFSSGTQMLAALETECFERYTVGERTCSFDCLANLF